MTKPSNCGGGGGGGGARAAGRISAGGPAEKARGLSRTGKCFVFVLGTPSEPKNLTCDLFTPHLFKLFLLLDCFSSPSDSLEFLVTGHQKEAFERTTHPP